MCIIITFCDCEWMSEWVWFTQLIALYQGIRRVKIETDTHEEKSIINEIGGEFAGW